MAYVIYEDQSAMNAAYDKLMTSVPTVDGKQLRLMKYDTSVEWPTGDATRHSSIALCVIVLL